MVQDRRIVKAPDGLFGGEEAVLHLIERIVGPLGLRIDESSLGDVRLPGGSRVQARSLRALFIQASRRRRQLIGAR